MIIYHFVDTYLRFTETFIYNYISASSFDRTNKVSILTVKMENTEYFPLPNDTRLIYVYNNPFKSRKTLSGMWSYLLRKLSRHSKLLRMVRKALLQDQPELVHCHFGQNAIAFLRMLEALHIKKKVIVSFYGFDVGYLAENHPGYVDELKVLWTKVAGVFCEGPHMLSKLILLGMPEEKGYLNPIIINTDNYPQKEIIQGRSNRPLKILIIGRFAEKKGIHLTLSALGDLKKEGFDNFMVSLVGDGPMKAEYSAIISAHQLQDQVDFKGMLPMDSCKILLVESDVLMHPSLEAKNKDSEGGAPTILIEAQFVGLPIIASLHADIPYVMGYHDFLCQENDVEDLKKVIRKFIDTPEEALNHVVALGRKHVIDQHSFKSRIYQDNLKAVAQQA